MKSVVLSNQKGFTLVELAMVMLIIGVLMGAIFKAQEMIENARVNRVVEDLIGFQASYYAYYDRTAEFPGNGEDHDRFIDYDMVGVDDGSFFSDLFSEGFIKSDNPLVAIYGTQYFANYLQASGDISTSNGTFLGRNQLCIINLKNTYAKSIDVRLDNGSWNTGSVRADSGYDSADTHTLCLEI